MLHDLLSNPVTGVLLGLAALAWILYRQLVKRPVREGGALRPVVVLGVVGLLQAGQVVGHATPAVVGGWVIGLAIGIALAALRGRTVRLTRENGVLMRQGTALTMVLWVVAIVVHLGIDFAAGSLTAGAGRAASFGSGTTLLYLAVVLGVQQAVVLHRARAVAPATA